MTDTNPRRFCTVPAIFGFRDWFERNYGDICEAHDKVYEEKGCTFCADIKFVKSMVKQDWKTKKRNLLFSVPAAPVAMVLFQGFKTIKAVGAIWKRFYLNT